MEIKMSNKAFYHWHTAENTFASHEAALACLEEMKQVSGEDVILHWIEQHNQALFEGYFDYDKFNDDGAEAIIAKHIQQPHGFSVKFIYNDEDGYFGGFAYVLDENGETIKSVNLNETFEV